MQVAESFEVLGRKNCPLRDLQDQLLRGYRPGLKQAADGLTELGVEQIPGGQVDGNRQVDSRGMPGVRLSERFVQHPSRQRLNQLGLFGGRDEVIRQEQAMLRMTPAHKRLDIVGYPGPKVDDRLIVEQKFKLIDGCTQAGYERGSNRRVGRGVRRVDAVAATSSL